MASQRRAYHYMSCHPAAQNLPIVNEMLQMVHADTGACVDDEHCQTTVPSYSSLTVTIICLQQVPQDPRTAAAPGTGPVPAWPLWGLGLLPSGTTPLAPRPSTSGCAWP